MQLIVQIGQGKQEGQREEQEHPMRMRRKEMRMRRYLLHIHYLYMPSDHKSQGIILSETSYFATFVNR